MAKNIICSNSVKGVLDNEYTEKINEFYGKFLYAIIPVITLIIYQRNG